MRRHADLKYNDAIGHLRFLMTQYHIPPAQPNIPDNIRPLISL
jgi:hypothetical protein